MENELCKEGAWPPAYRERQQVVGREYWDSLQKGVVLRGMFKGIRPL